ncbi:MAG: DUF2889 domain-containing protein [Actinobacteria bacterium]|nr:DUF2889 domain-containing protein [Actinomycetota bacterium]MBU4218080.1 DUF2889 domain-containing protein [Actinomycetota bacterium]MBU4357763.1 DUF2889 domain-containing protein [Actinomycetota bacterium]MBU4391616.1 DUF2889 domain-containing protein [Actinomycetota bacterium]MBU4403451.1 DUF2889 domain-containing protein [Actinomycetota bacterium]
MTLFERSIDIEVGEEDENIRVRGALADGRLGEGLHRLEVEMLVSVIHGEILEISGSMPEVPMEECAEGLRVLDEVLGEKITPGFTDLVRRTVGSNKGCTHLASLLVNMGNVSVQGRGAFVRKHFPDEESSMAALRHAAGDLDLLDSCVCWGEDGPILGRRQE